MSEQIVHKLMPTKSLNLHRKLPDAGFSVDMFGQYKKTMPDGTQVIFYESWFGWTVDLTTPDGKTLTEDDLDIKMLMHQCINQTN